MEVLEFNKFFFIKTPEGYFMIDPTAKSGKAISEDCFNLISELSELSTEIKELAQ